VKVLEPKPPAPPPVEAPQPPPPKDPAREAQLDRLTGRFNAAFVAATVLLHRRRTTELAELRRELAAWELELAQAERESGSARGRFQAGDDLVMFAGSTLDRQNPVEFTDVLFEWLRSSTSHREPVMVRRAGVATPLIVHFGSRTPDFVALALRAGARIEPPPAPPSKPESALPTPPPAAEVERALPADLLARAKSELAALPPHYRKSLPAEDVKRLEALLAAGRGKSVDEDFLRSRILEDLFRRAREEYGEIAARVASLEEQLLDARSVDVVHFKDGRTLEGVVEQETPDSVRLRSRYGAVNLPLSEVARVEKGKGGSAEFAGRYRAAVGKPDELLALAAWCRERNFGLGRELSCAAALKIDPGNEKAWAELGQTPGSRGGRPAGPEHDVVRLRDGSVVTGCILAESDSALTLEVVLRGSRGEAVGLGRQVLQKSEVTAIERMDEAARARARGRASAFEAREKRQGEALAQIRLSAVEFRGGVALRASAPQFELTSMCDEETSREMTFYLREMFDAYQRHFGIIRNLGRRIEIYILADARQYKLFQRERLGGETAAIAFYHPVDNYIAAYNVVQSAEAERIRTQARHAESRIAAVKKEIAAQEQRVEQRVKELRNALENRPTGQSDRAEHIRMIKNAEREVMDELAAYRRAANRQLEQNLRTIAHNRQVLVQQGRLMYEALFHEAFHAFATNYLWEEVDNRGIPRWLHEGMASYFERSAIEMGEIVHGAVHPSHLKTVRAQSVPLINLLRATPQSFNITHLDGGARSAAHYAASWALVHYLISRVTRAQLEAYVIDVMSGTDPAAAFEKLAGKKVPAVEIELWRHLEGLK
jgi:hypothetical protein